MEQAIRTLVGKARELARSGALDRMLEGVDPVLVRRATDEARRVANAFGSPEEAARGALEAALPVRESVVGAALASLMGLHYTAKLLKAIKDQRPLVAGTLGLPMIRMDLNDEGFPIGYKRVPLVKRALHTVMLFLTLYFGQTFALRSVLPTRVHLRDAATGEVVQMVYRWSGLHDYTMHDASGNRYKMVWRGGLSYDLVKDGRVIMTVKDGPVEAAVRSWGFQSDGWVFYGPDGRPAFTETRLPSTMSPRTSTRREKLFLSPFEGIGGDMAESAGRKRYIPGWRYFKG